MENRKIHFECTGKRWASNDRKRLERVEVLVYELSGGVQRQDGVLWWTITEAYLLMVYGLRLKDVYRISSFDRGITQDSIRVHISKINKKFEAIGLTKLIVSTKRFEYCLVASSCNFYPLFLSTFEAIHPDDQALVDAHIATPLALLTGLDRQNCCPKCGCNLE